MASLYLVRHARVAAGDAHDPGLSSLGRLQAGLLADRLLELEVGAVLHSPLNRAAETATVLADRLKIAATPSSLVLVTHAFVIGWLVCDALDAPSWRWLSLAPDNASLSILSYDPERGSQVIAFNDTGHSG